MPAQFHLSTLFALLCLLPACGSKEPVTLAPTPLVNAPQEATTPIQPVVEHETPVTHSRLPQNFESITQACDSSEAQHAFEVLCAPDNSIAGLYQPGDFLLQEPPASFVVITNHKDEDTGPRTKSLFIAIEGSRIWVRRITCPGCARVMGWSFLGDLPKMSNNEILALQSKLGIPATIPLRSAEGWQAAYELP